MTRLPCSHMRTTQLLSQGRIFDISRASPDRIHDGIFGAATVRHGKWGVNESFRLLVDDRAGFEAGYVEGKDGGSLRLAAPMLTDAAMKIHLGGSVSEARFSAGDSYARPTGTEHDVMNAGAEPMAFIEIEFKRRA